MASKDREERLKAREAKRNEAKVKLREEAKKQKEALIDMAISFLNTKSGLKLIGVKDKDLETFIRDKKARNQLIKDNTPEIGEFKIKGRIFDKETGLPIEGASISPLLVQIEEESPVTDKDGKFIINISIPILNNGKAILTSQLFYTAENYNPINQTLLNLDKTIQTDLPTVSLLNIEKAAEIVVNEVQLEMDKAIEKASSIFLNGIDKIIVLRRKAIAKFTNAIKLRLLPLAIQIFVLFGVVKIQDIVKGKTCPPPKLLAEAIRKRNKIVKQLNQMYKVIIVNSALAAVVLYISYQLRGLKATISNITLPLGAPLGVGIPYNVVSAFENIKEKLQELIDDNKNLNKQVIISLIFLIVAIVIILIYLKKIDEMIQDCSQQANLEPISDDLLKLREENEKDGLENEDLTASLNGFYFSVIDGKNEVGTLKRRQAIAKNKDGVILLKGEPSFSASDQILIDELKFYIQTNNLKAF